MATFTRFAQIVNCASCNNFTAVLNKRIKQLLKVQSLRLAIDQGNGVDTENTLQLGLSKQVVQHNLWHFTTAQFNNDPHTIFIRLITQLSDAFYLLVFNQLSDLFDQSSFVDHVGNFSENDGNFAVPLIFFKLMTSTKINTTSSRSVCVNDTITAVDKCRRWEIRPWDVLHQVIDGQIWIIN